MVNLVTTVPIALFTMVKLSQGHNRICTVSHVDTLANHGQPLWYVQNFGLSYVKLVTITNWILTY